MVNYPPHEHMPRFFKPSLLDPGVVIPPAGMPPGWVDTNYYPGDNYHRVYDELKPYAKYLAGGFGSVSVQGKLIFGGEEYGNLTPFINGDGGAWYGIAGSLFSYEVAKTPAPWSNNSDPDPAKWNYEVLISMAWVAAAGAYFGGPTRNPWNGVSIARFTWAHTFTGSLNDPDTNTTYSRAKMVRSHSFDSADNPIKVASKTGSWTQSDIEWSSWLPYYKQWTVPWGNTFRIMATGVDYDANPDKWAAFLNPPNKPFPSFLNGPSRKYGIWETESVSVGSFYGAA